MAHKQSRHGARIGSYLGRPIFESIRNQDTTYVFDRIALCIDDEYPLDQLGKDEVLLAPGLIYKQL